MTDMKCPFCQQELEINDLDVQLLGCENQNCKHSIHYDTVGSKELWQELIRTRKALDVATKCINWVIGTFQKGLEHESDVVGCCELSLERIEEQEQKDK